MRPWPRGDEAYPRRRSRRDSNSSTRAEVCASSEGMAGFYVTGGARFKVSRWQSFKVSEFQGFRESLGTLFPQRLKPRLLAIFCGTTKSRTLPGWRRSESRALRSNIKVKASLSSKKRRTKDGTPRGLSNLFPESASRRRRRLLFGRLRLR